jgi:hypothetical protein
MVGKHAELLEKVGHCINTVYITRIPKFDKCVSESSRTIIVVTASVKEDERGGQGHTSAKPIESVCHVIPRCEHALFLHECFSTFLCFVCDGWQNRATCLHQVLREAR